MSAVRFALYLLVALVPALVLHEYAHARVADKLGDPTPRRWGRLSLDPRPMIDPFGSVILPALILILIASSIDYACLLPVFAYAKPMPHDPSYLRRRDRDPTIVALAGPAANLVLAGVAGVPIRVLSLGPSSEVGLFLFAWVVVNVFMLVFQLMPIPGLDGSRLLVRVLPPRAREVYVNLDHYLVLFILVLFFVLAGPFQAIVRGIANILFRLLVGSPFCF